MEKVSYLKAVFTAIFAIISAIFGELTIPILLMVACNLIDYITGLMASQYRKEDINSYKSIRGIFKKVSMWLLVMVGALIDQLILYTGNAMGLKIPLSYLIACIVAIWIICNELISILENIKDMGGYVPPFLEPLLKNIKSQVEKQGEIEEHSKEENIVDK